VAGARGSRRHQVHHIAPNAVELDVHRIAQGLDARQSGRPDRRVRRPARPGERLGFSDIAGRVLLDQGVYAGIQARQPDRIGEGVAALDLRAEPRAGVAQLVGKVARLVLEGSLVGRNRGRVGRLGRGGDDQPPQGQPFFQRAHIGPRQIAVGGDVGAGQAVDLAADLPGHVEGHRRGQPHQRDEAGGRGDDLDRDGLFHPKCPGAASEAPALPAI
jgi:hypothetical protein